MNYIFFICYAVLLCITGPYAVVSNKCVCRFLSVDTASPLLLPNLYLRGFYTTALPALFQIADILLSVSPQVSITG